MKKLAMTAALLVCLATSQLFAIEFRWAPNDLVGSQEASCRVSVSNARGSGTFFEYTDTKAYILTNYHVVTNHSTAILDFWTNHERQSIQAKVVWRSYNIDRPYDFAILEVDANELKQKIDPPFIPLKPEGATVPDNRFIISAGCPKGQHVQAWKGKVIGKQGRTTLFTAHPSHGQSGSALCGTINGKIAITDVCTWLMGDENSDASQGGAISVDNLYEALQKTHFEPASESIEPAAESIEPAVPLDAVECAENVNVKVLYFTRPNCRACEKLAPNLGVLGDIVKLDTSTPLGATRAAEFRIDLVPSFVIVDDNNKEVTRFVGADRFGDLVSFVKPETPEEAKPTIECEEGMTCEIPLEEKEPEVKEIASKTIDTSFRNRAPVFEPTDDIAFLDNNRNRWFFNEEPKQEEPPKPTEPTVPQIDESKLGDRLGDRLSGKITNGITNSINGSLDTIVDGIEKRLNEKIEQRLDEMKVKLVAWRIKFAMAILAIVIIGVLFADSVKQLFLFVCRFIKKSFYSLVNKAAQNIQEKATVVAKKTESVATAVAKTTSKKTK